LDLVTAKLDAKVVRDVLEKTKQELESSKLAVKGPSGASDPVKEKGRTDEQGSIAGAASPAPALPPPSHLDPKASSLHTIGSSSTGIHPDHLLLARGS